ncbi:hypothetical protein TCON_2142 [Astathelohania contejeani]|uniref:Uncharacterized protein n=1 Tax=Astathelohania contejeani TaxID=164912 RepID=A0ABQ7HWT2_9MICR|nr:hypothetical protein TCON_2142 [Thelohania contejeani]
MKTRSLFGKQQIEKHLEEAKFLYTDRSKCYNVRMKLFNEINEMENSIDLTHCYTPPSLTNEKNNQGRRAKTATINDLSTWTLNDKEIECDLRAIYGKLETDPLPKKVNVNNGILKIGKETFQRGVTLRATMHGEVFQGVVTSINSTEIAICTKEKEKVKLQIRGIREGTTIIERRRRKKSNKK